MEEPKIKLKKVSTADTSPRKLGYPSRLAYDCSKLKKATQTLTTEDAAEPKSTTTDAYTSALKNMRKIIVVPSLEQASSEEPNPYASVLKNKEKSSLSWEDGPPISTEEAVEMIQVREDDTSHPDEFLTSSSTVLSPSTGLKSLRDNLQFDASISRPVENRLLILITSFGGNAAQSVNQSLALPAKFDSVLGCTVPYPRSPDRNGIVCFEKGNPSPLDDFVYARSYC